MTPGHPGGVPGTADPQGALYARMRWNVPPSASPPAAGGTLLVIARATNEAEPARDPAMMPWALTRRELELAGGPLRLERAEQFLDDEDPPKLRWRAEFRRDLQPFPG